MAGLIKRGKTYYAQYYLGGRAKRVSLRTDSYKMAREKLRKLESGLARGEDNPLPGRTPVADVLNAYARHIRAFKTAKSAQTDIYYLREAFGPVCDALTITSRRTSEKTRKRPLKRKVDGRRRLARIEASCFEQIATSQISAFISGLVQARGLAPKTANRYREILTRLFNWAMKERGIRMPNDKNPAAAVGRYKEKAPKIRFLSLKQIEEQLEAIERVARERELALKHFLAKHGPDCSDQQKLQRLRQSVMMARQIKVMVAMYIYAGLRREELLWLQIKDVDLNAGPNGMIRVQAKEVAGEYWEPKTKVNRAVPVSRCLRAHLEGYSPRLVTGRFYFPSRDGLRYDPDNFSRDLRVIQEQVGLAWGCLDFRHTFGSQLAMKGESLYKISALMGNSPEICRRHYAALVPEMMLDAVEFQTAKVNGTASRSGLRLA